MNKLMVLAMIALERIKAALRLKGCILSHEWGEWAHAAAEHTSSAMHRHGLRATQARTCRACMAVEVLVEKA